MSTLKTTNIQHPSATSPAIVLDTAGLITGTGTSLGAWTAYTPTWTATTTNPTLGNGVLYGDYCRIGKLVVVRIDLQIGSTSTLGSGGYRISLPFTARYGVAGLLGLFQAFDASLGQTWQLAARSPGDTANAGFTTGHLPVQFVNTTTPFTWTSGDNLAGIFYYEAV